MILRISNLLIAIFCVFSLSAQIQGAEFARSNGKPNWNPELDQGKYYQSLDTTNRIKWYWSEGQQDWYSPDLETSLPIFNTVSDYTSSGSFTDNGDIIFITGNGSEYIVSQDTVRGYPTDGIGVIDLGNGSYAQLKGEVTPFHFGAVGDGSFDDAPALNKFFLFLSVKEIDNDLSGQFYTGSMVEVNGKNQTWLPASNRSTATKSFDGEMRLKALTQIDTMLKIINFSHCTWREKVQVVGLGSVPFAARPCKIGVYLSNCARASFGGFHVRAFRLYGVKNTSEIGNSGGLNIREVTAERIGSGSNGQIQNSDFSYYEEHEKTGSPNNSNQRSRIVVANLPESDLLTDHRINDWPVIINSEPYHIKAIVGDTLEIYPWIDNAEIDTIKYVYGAGFVIAGADGGLSGVGIVNVNNCGIGIDITPIYGIDIGRLISQFNGMGLVLGRSSNSAMISNNINYGYWEADDIEVYQLTRATSVLGSYNINTLGPHILDKWFVPFNRNVAGDKNELGNYETTSTLAGEFIEIDSLRN